MNKSELKQLLSKCTTKMSIDIEDIPKEKVFKIVEKIGSMLLKEGLKFTYGGIGEGITDKICGVNFEIENL